MKFTLSWLKEYLETSASLEEICETLTNIGLEVEEVEDKAKSLANFEVAHIIEAKKLENSKKLQICKVQTANCDQLLQVICGAPNARTGLKIAFAPIGSVIPTNQMVIKKAKIAGVESSGMICSASELGLGEDSDGIIEIDDKIAIGTKITEVFSLNDAIIEINVTPNRGDCLGIYGIAQDLSAAGLGKLKKLQIDSKIDTKSEIHTDSYALFRKINGVKNCESPTWLKNKLESIGHNSISAIVDITNYIMFSLNRPMHAYDAAKIEGEIVVGRGENGEKFLSLKDEEFTLSKEDIVIKDDKKIVGIAGIIGAKNSTTDLETTNIILEAAFFDPEIIANSGRRLNLQTDSRYRFERGVDYKTCLAGIDLATKLITEICGGKAEEIISHGEELEQKIIEFDYDKIKKLIGIKVDKDKIIEILSNLEFEIAQNGQNLSIKIPSHRHDVSCNQDLIEEVIRIVGYNKIKEEPLEISSPKAENNIIHKSRKLLSSRGMVEAINWSFCDSNLVEIFAQKRDDLTIANPISIEMDHMRPTLLIGLLSSYKKNLVRGFENLSLFEVGNIYENQQKLMISGIRSGKNKEQDHYQDQRDFDIFDCKKDLEEICKLYGLNPESLQINSDEAPKYYHPHRSGALKLGRNIIGYFGEINPKILKKFDIKNKVNSFEIFVENLPNKQKTNKKPFKVSDLQAVERDFAFLVDQNQEIANIIKTIKSCNKELIKEVNIFDIYQGENIQNGKKSIALRALIQPKEKTLTSQEIDEISQKIINQTQEKHQASLRS